MMCSDQVVSLPFIKAHDGPYNPSLASSASSSQTSVWSKAASQSSDDTSISGTYSDSSQECDVYYSASCSVNPASSTVPRELRQNPRRTNSGASSRNSGPPSLVRQCDRKVNFVDNLVDSSTQIVEAIWPLSHVHRPEPGSKGVLPLRTFIQETLRRSRTSYSTLQVALYYLVLIKPHVPNIDFTMEQPDDLHTSRVLQCGRRMFLAALILASKYLQDRNYSAKAWSRISGLQTHEINQNEMAFLTAVNWKLHITDDVFKRWTDVVMKYTPSQPSTPGSALSVEVEQQCRYWKNLILRLTPELDNVAELVSTVPPTRLNTSGRDYATPASPRSLIANSRDRSHGIGTESADATPTPRHITPVVMEPPAPTSVYTPGRLAPALGLLPTPRLTPQTPGFSTPAAGAASQILGSKCSMGLAMSQASNAAAAQSLDRWPGSAHRSSPPTCLARRSSLATSVSTASSPESMISDSSLTSRSSSISSVSSSVSAPSSKLDVQARCRYAKLCNERYSMRPTVAPVLEDFQEDCITASPESYSGSMGKDLMDMTLDVSPQRAMDDETSAAHALQELQYYASGNINRGLKRSRPCPEDSLQDNVRNLLRGQRLDALSQDFAMSSSGSRKRTRTNAILPTDCRVSSLHPALGGVGGPGMWSGILS